MDHLKDPMLYSFGNQDWGNGFYTVYGRLANKKTTEGKMKKYPDVESAWKQQTTSINFSPFSLPRTMTNNTGMLTQMPMDQPNRPSQETNHDDDVN